MENRLFLPPAPLDEPRSPLPREIDDLVTMIAGRSVTVLTGAGCSTDSGIPDYRGPNGTLRRRRPMTISEFLAGDEARRHYWARSFAGWDAMKSSRPNGTHAALASLERAGVVRHLITQNVDELHRKGGSRSITDLHGVLSRVVCLDCGELSDRDRLQTRLRRLNERWLERDATINPDGDAELGRDETATFVIAACERCDGRLKPDVVFFGESVPRERVDQAMRSVDEGDVLMVVGSSLTVWSGYRFVRRAVERDTPVALINWGPTRADELASLKIEARCSETLQQTVRQLGLVS